MASTATSQHRCVFVGNIPYDATEEQLIQICEEVGPVVSFRLVLDRETGKPKGYGFCEYKDEETALSARRNLQGYEINGRQLRVDFAENDKGADRNREQGRGGPGLTSTTDAQKPLPGPPVGDSALHQPVGLPLAATAASLMAGALGRGQTSSLIQNGSQNLCSLGNDPLTHYLAKMSRQQLNEIMSEIKNLATQKKALAQQLLQGMPHLPQALFQVQIMLGMVTPQMMEMAKSRQPSSTIAQPSLQDSILSKNPLPPSHLGQTPLQTGAPVGPLRRPPETEVSNALQNPAIFQQPGPPLQHVPVQPSFQHALPPQHQNLLQGMVPGKSGASTGPQSLGSLPNLPQAPSLPTSKGVLSQAPSSLLQHSRPTGPADVGHHHQSALPDTSLQQSYLPHPLTSQATSSNYPGLLNGLETLSKETGTSTSVSKDMTRASRISAHSSSVVGLAEQTGTAGYMPELFNHRARRPRVEDGGGTHLMMNSSYSAISSGSVQSSGNVSIPGSQVCSADGLQHSEKQTPQLPPEVESALLQQVMNLTPEQLSSLPPEQQQQVLQLQQMLR